MTVTVFQVVRMQKTMHDIIKITMLFQKPDGCRVAIWIYFKELRA